MTELTYAKVDGPPDNWADVFITDLDTGQLIDSVIEVNAAEGWLIRHARDEDGRLLPNEAGDGCKTERIEGRFALTIGKPEAKGKSEEA